LHPDGFASLPEKLRQNAATGLLVALTGGVQVLAEVSGTLPGSDEFRVEWFVQFAGQHLVFFGWHRASLILPNGQALPPLPESLQNHLRITDDVDAHVGAVE
jgi:hypothetical protein